jgi:uncharacterized protein (UPF0147 family)
VNAPNLHLVRTREQTIEEALRALTEVMKDTSIPSDVRDKCWEAYRPLHACRSPETVRRMEHEKGLR